MRKLTRGTSNLVGSAEAATTLGISRATFNRWVALGRIIPTVDMEGATGARLFDPEVIDRLAGELHPA